MIHLRGGARRIIIVFCYPADALILFSLLILENSSPFLLAFIIFSRASAPRFTLNANALQERSNYRRAFAVQLTRLPCFFPPTVRAILPLPSRCSIQHVQIRLLNLLRRLSFASRENETSDKTDFFGEHEI